MQLCSDDDDEMMDSALINESSALPPDGPRPYFLDKGLRTLFTPRIVQSAVLRFDGCGVNDPLKSSFIERELNNEDLEPLRALHAEWFPLDYHADFFEHACNGTLMSIALCCKIDNQRDCRGNKVALSSRAASEAPDPSNWFFRLLPPFRAPKPVPAPLAGVCVLSCDNEFIMEESIRTFWCLVAQRVVRELPNIQEVVDLLAYLPRHIDDPTIDRAAIAGSMGYIMTLGILQEFRGKGLAKYLVQAAKRRILAVGRSVLYLHVVEYNLTAIRMYKQCGFTILTEIPNFYEIYGKRYSSYLAAWVDPSAVDTPLESMIRKATKTAINQLSETYW